MVGGLSWSLQAVLQLLQVFENIRAEVKFAGVWHGFLNHVFEFIHIHMVMQNEKNEIIVIGVRTAIQFTQRDAIVGRGLPSNERVLPPIKVNWDAGGIRILSVFRIA